jgi:hypothetical protein
VEKRYGRRGREEEGWESKEKHKKTNISIFVKQQTEEDEKRMSEYQSEIALWKEVRTS